MSKTAFKDLNDLFQSMPLPTSSSPTAPQTPPHPTAAPTAAAAPAAAAVGSPRTPTRITASKQYSSMSRLPCATATRGASSLSCGSSAEAGSDALPSKPSRPAPTRPGAARPFRTASGTAAYSQTCRPALTRVARSGSGAVDTPQ